MPGYDCPVIMAAGAFIQGASIELSCDAPMREPYAAYMQGGPVSYTHLDVYKRQYLRRRAAVFRIAAASPQKNRRAGLHRRIPSAG